MSETVLIAALFCLIGLSALLSLTETALFSLSPISLRSCRASKDPNRRLVAQLMDRPRDVLVTILMFNVLSNLLIQNTVSSIFDQFPNWILKVGVPLVLTLVFGEVLPKSIALPNNALIAPYAVRPIHWLMRAFKPIRTRLNAFASLMSRIFFSFLKDEEEVSPDELRHVVKTSLKRGVLSKQEAELIEGTLDLKKATVKELMRPREEVLFFDIHEPLGHLIDLFVDQECTRVPVCDGQIDTVLGIVSTRRFFLHQNEIKTSGDVAGILRKPYYAPETMRGWALLQVLREMGEDMAIVVDEYGSISGLITQEDLIEAVVGEIADRRDEKSLYTRSGSDVVIASGKLEVQEFEEIFGVQIKPRGHAVTIGGWLIEQLEDIPAAGTKYVTDDFLFYVLAADPNRIRRVYIRQVKSSKKKAGGES